MTADGRIGKVIAAAVQKVGNVSLKVCLPAVARGRTAVVFEPFHRLGLGVFPNRVRDSAFTLAAATAWCRSTRELESDQVVAKLLPGELLAAAPGSSPNPDGRRCYPSQNEDGAHLRCLIFGQRQLMEGELQDQQAGSYLRQSKRPVGSGPDDWQIREKGFMRLTSKRDVPTP